MCAGVDPSGAVVGAVALSQRAFDGSGLIHWLHAQDDDPGVISALLSHACQTLGPRRLYAFSEPAICALALVPGLPVGHHHRLADLLMGARFVPYARQCYLLLDDLLLPGRPARLPDEPPTDVTRVRSPDGWRLRIRHGAGTAASAVVLACRMTQPCCGSSVSARATAAAAWEAACCANASTWRSHAMRAV